MVSPVGGSAPQFDPLWGVTSSKGIPSVAEIVQNLRSIPKALENKTTTRDVAALALDPLIEQITYISQHSPTPGVDYDGILGNLNSLKTVLSDPTFEDDFVVRKSFEWIDFATDQLARGR